MYLEYWTEDVVANMGNLSPEVDHTREYPTPYHFLLYDIVWTQRRWIEAASQIDPELESVQIERINLEYEGIAKSAVISMATCLRTIVESPNISGQYKGYIFDVVTRGYADVVEHGTVRLAEVYELAILEGGKAHRDYEPYRRGILQALEHADQGQHILGPGQQLMRRLQERLRQE
jgi:hypothetical protein